MIEYTKKEMDKMVMYERASISTARLYKENHHMLFRTETDRKRFKPDNALIALTKDDGRFYELRYGIWSEIEEHRFLFTDMEYEERYAIRYEKDCYYTLTIVESKEEAIKIAKESWNGYTEEEKKKMEVTAEIIDEYDLPLETLWSSINN